LFVRHDSCKSCGSSDGYAVYVDEEDKESGHCFVCGYTVASSEIKELLKEGNSKRKNKLQEQKVNFKETSDVVTEEETQQIKDKTTNKGLNYRGIRDETLRYFGVRVGYNEEDGSVKAVYYPCTQNNKLVGWKVREHPKKFYTEAGRTGASCQLFGQFRFPNESKTCLVVGGEQDQLAAFQMLKEYADSKNWSNPPVVVSPTVGEKCNKQLAGQYEWFNKFEKIVVGFDNDEAGEEAFSEAVKVLPKGKVYQAKWNMKDPNELLLADKQRNFISSYYEAKKYTPAGIIASNTISKGMREELKIPKIPLPPFMHKLQKMMAGGIPLGRIVNIGSASGTGKSTIIDEMLYFWVFNSPHKIGVISLEASVSQYGIKLLSRHISQKIELLSNEEAGLLLDTEVVQKKEYELLNTEDGEARFHLIDERDGGVEVLKGLIVDLIVSMNCKVIICDPLQDIIESLPETQQVEFIAFQKGLIKSHMVTFLNVSHMRKNSTGQQANSTGAELHEEDFHGSSVIFKSGAANLIFTRNKEAEDPTERNTTYMKATKIRWTGITGPAGKYYYELEKHLMHDYDDYFTSNLSV
jgi:archaellum biogenesis ATPase FlaH